MTEKEERHIIKTLKRAGMTLEHPNSLREVAEVVGPVIAGISIAERNRIGRRLWFRQYKWSKKFTGRNPYTAVAFHIDPPVGGS